MKRRRKMNLGVKHWAINVADVMMRGEKHIVHPNFFEALEDALLKHGYRIECRQLGIRGTELRIVPYEERDNGE
jgi:hypothetical protein